VLTYVLHVAVECIVTSPKDDTYVALSCISDELFEVDLGNNLHEVGLLVYCPTLVEDYILDTVATCEVDVCLVCSVVNTGVEIYAVDVPAVPPLPSYLTGLDP
jgi:hypothetical protein